MAWQTFFAQDRGGRSEQQDHGGAWPSPDGKSVLVVLADGAGGHHGGMQAAQAAVEAAGAFWQSAPPAPAEAAAFLETISRAAHEEVRKRGRSEQSSRATWAALLAGENEAHWVHSGDTRLYHFRHDRLLSRTRDHSVVQLLLERGKITERDIPTHRDRSLLLQSLGGAEYLPVEGAGSASGKDDVFFLCTDGVWMDRPEAELGKIARAPAGQRAALTSALVRQAAQAGGDRADNASLWCVFRDKTRS
jgi:serine/threonine protein phosphatase PrpC